MANIVIAKTDLTDPPPEVVSYDGNCYKKVEENNKTPLVTPALEEFPTCLDCSANSIEYLECPSGTTIYVDPSILTCCPWPLAVEIGSVCYEFVGPSLTAPDTFSVDDQFNACDPSVSCCCGTAYIWRYCDGDAVFGIVPAGYVNQDYGWAHPVVIAGKDWRPSKVYRTEVFGQPAIAPCFIVNHTVVRTSCSELDYSDFTEPWTEVWLNDTNNNQTPHCYVQIKTDGASTFNGNGGGTVSSTARGFLSIGQIQGDWNTEQYTGNVTGEFSVSVTVSNTEYGHAGSPGSHHYLFRLINVLGQTTYGVRIALKNAALIEDSNILGGPSIAGSVSFGDHTLRIDRDISNDIRVKVDGITYFTVNDPGTMIGVQMAADANHGTTIGATPPAGLFANWSAVTWTGG